MKKNKWIDGLNTLFEKINSFEGSLFVYSLSFSLLLTIPPAITVFVSSFEILNLDVSVIPQFLSQFLPRELIEPFIDFLMNKSSASFTVSLISMGASLYLSSRANYSFLLIALNDEEVSYPKWSVRLYSVFEFLLIYLYVLGIIALATYLSQYFMFAVPVLLFSASFIGFYAFFHLCTFKVRGKKFGLAGALFSSSAIFLVGLLFFRIVAEFTRYDSIYGPLSSLMVLFLSVFIVSNIIYFGYVINILTAPDIQKEKNNPYFKLCERLEKKLLEKVKEKL